MTSSSSIPNEVQDFLFHLALIFLICTLITAIIDAIRFVLFRRRPAPLSSTTAGHRAPQPEKLDSALGLVTDVLGAPLGVMLRAVRGFALSILQLCVAVPLLMLRMAFGIVVIGFMLSLMAPQSAGESAGLAAMLSSVLSSVLKPKSAPEYVDSVVDAVVRNTLGTRYRMRNNAWDQLVSATLAVGDCTWTPSPWAADEWRGTSDCTRLKGNG